MCVEMQAGRVAVDHAPSVRAARPITGICGVPHNAALPLQAPRLPAFVRQNDNTRQPPATAAALCPSSHSYHRLQVYSYSILKRGHGAFYWHDSDPTAWHDLLHANAILRRPRTQKS